MINFTSKLLKSAAVAALMTATAQIANAETLTMSSWVPPTHFVHTDFLVPFTEKKPGQVKPYETRGAGDEDAHGGTERRPPGDVKPEMPPVGEETPEPASWRSAPIC